MEQQLTMLPYNYVRDVVCILVSQVF